MRLMKRSLPEIGGPWTAAFHFARPPRRSPRRVICYDRSVASPRHASFPATIRAFRHGRKSLLRLRRLRTSWIRYRYPQHNISQRNVWLGGALGTCGCIIFGRSSGAKSLGPITGPVPPNQRTDGRMDGTDAKKQRNASTFLRIERERERVLGHRDHRVRARFAPRAPRFVMLEPRT